MQAELAALVGSRICHDLISPIGAINNGVELMALTGGTAGEEMALIKESVETASARIKFFRIAYGSAEEEQLVSTKEVVGILAPLSGSGRVNHIWELQGEQPRPLVRCLFLLIQALETALPLGGTITVAPCHQRILLTAAGNRINYDGCLWDILNTGCTSPEKAAANVQFALLPDALDAAARKLEVEVSEGKLAVRL